MAAYTPAEEQAGIDALNQLVQQDVPGFEQAFITPQLVKQVVDTVLTAAAKARQ